jgi:Domain of unknown function (DUF222)
MCAPVSGLPTAWNWRAFMSVVDGITEHLAAVDAAIAERIVSWGPMSEYKLTQVIDLWVDKIDPAALRRTRNKARTRDFTVADGTGTAAVFGRLFATDATLLDQRLAAMARGVCAAGRTHRPWREGQVGGHPARGTRAALPPVEGTRRVRPDARHDLPLPRLRPTGGVQRHRPHRALPRGRDASRKPQVLEGVA